MSLVEKLLLVGGVAKAAYTKWLIKRLITAAIIVAGLTIVGSIMVSALLVGLFHFAFFMLLASNVPTFNAYLIVGGAMLFLIIVILLSIRFYVYHMRHLIAVKSPTHQGMELFESFMRGLNSKEEPKKD